MGAEVSMNDLNMSKLIRSPRLWLTVQLVAIMVVGGVFGLWRVQMFPDSPNYISASTMALEPALSQSRTLGYPMILRLVATFSPDYQAIPWVHLAMLWPAVFLLDFAVRRYGASPWQAFAVSSGFMYGAIQQIWTVRTVATDTPATVVAGMAIACLFLIVANPKHLGAWVCLTFFLTASYQIRPAYLFLIPLAPCLGIVLVRVYAKWRRERFIWKKMLLGLIAISVLPFLAYCSFRWMVVGDFALVSFGGESTVGLATALLDEKMIESELSDRFQPFAREILEGRKERHLKPVFPGGWWVDMRAYERSFSTNIYRIAKPAATRLLSEDAVVRNREMASFSREVIAHRKGRYLLWAVYFWLWTVMKVARRYWILQVAIPFLFFLFVIRRYRMRYSKCSSPKVPWTTNLNASVLPALMWLNVIYIGTSISLLIAAGTYENRFIIPTAVYLPSLVGLLILRELKALCSTASIEQSGAS